MYSDTILIIDDDLFNRGILDNLFSPYYAVEEAENGRVGLDKILTSPEHYCAILLDVVMPEMDGLEVLRRLNDLGYACAIGVVLAIIIAIFSAIQFKVAKTDN